MTERQTRPGRGHTGSSSSGGARRRGAGPTLARLIALRVLERVERVRAYADIALHDALAQSNMTSVDRALATELVYGTLRWRGRLDFLLRGALDRDLDQLEPLVTTTLRIGAYQICFSDRIPASAAVDEAVRCARAVGAERATGLVNAVLRRVALQREHQTFPELESDPLGHLMHALSLPRWIAERWLHDYGAEQAAALARASNAPPPLTARVNARRGGRDELLEKLRERFPAAEPCKLAPFGVVLARKGDPGRDPCFLAGDYTIQDEAAQLVIELLDVQPGDLVLDVCAAPGTKTTGIAERLGPAGHVLALDRHARRLSLVARAARRLGLESISTLCRDASQPLLDLPVGPGGAPPEGGARFDRVLADVPCSGLGTLRRNPDARWRLRPGDPLKLAAVQLAILTNSAAVLRPGGSLVYSTCTLLGEENEQIVQRFLESHREFRLVPKSRLPAVLAPLLDDSGLLRCFPHLHDTDGFFAARLERVE